MTDTAPALTLSDEVVLLTLECRRRRVARALKLGGLPDLRAVTRDLARRELIEVSPLRRRPRAAAAPLALSRRRLSGTVRSVSTPSGADAELPLLVAFAGGLQSASTADHLNARHRIAALGSDGAAPPPLLSSLCAEVGAGSAGELAAKLLPGRVRVRPGELDPGVTEAVWGGGHGGGTLG